MPVLIAIVVIAFAAGLLIRQRPLVWGLTGALAVLANIVFVWAVADGRGDDPGWLILLSIAGAGVAFAAAWAGLSIRRRLAPAGRAAAA